jgi:tetratricopeptide (TPR) repeat protein
VPTTSRRSTPKTRKTGRTRPASEDQALKLYEEGLKAFGRKEFSRALAVFESVLKEHPGEPEICDRARIYINICKASSAQSTRPRTPDDFYYQGVLAANECRHEQAAEMFEQALGGDPGNDKAMYGLAVVSLLLNDRERALGNLARAIERNTANRIYALNDTSFDEIRDDPQFVGLVGKPREASE